MEIVISDTTALIHLGKLNKLKFINNIYTKVYIPKEVYNEVLKKDDIVLKRLKEAEYIEIKELTNKKLYLYLLNEIGLDNGESGAIALAEELNLELLIDEFKGRATAKKLDLDFIGTLGLIISNFENNFITYDEAISTIEELKENRFKINKIVEKEILEELKKIKLSK